jgi:PAS domain S-box-containing protein
MSTVKSYNYILLLGIGLLLCTMGNAQSSKNLPARYYVEHFGEEEGLPQNSVNSILPDNNDFLWIATEGGIARFNGNRFLPVPFKTGVVSGNFNRIKNFFYKGKDTILAYSSASNMVATIVNNTVIAIEKHNYVKHGLLFLNLHRPVPTPPYIVNYTSDSIRQHWNIKDGSYSGTVHNKDIFLVRLDDGIGIYDSKGLVRKILINNLDQYRLLFLNRQVIYVDAENYVNFYSAAGLQKRVLLPIALKKGQGIFHGGYGNEFFCVKDSVLYRVDITSSGALAVQTILSNLQHPNDVRVIYQKDSNTIVTGTIRNGLYVYKKQFFSITDPLPSGESDAFYVQRLLSDNETILTGTDKLFKNGRFLGKTKSLFTTHIYSYLKDSKGNYWYPYFDRLIRAKEIGIAAETLMTYKGMPIILFEDRDGRIWFASTQQFGYFKNDAFTELKFNNLNPGLISCIQQDTEGRYLIGTRDGLFTLDNANASLLNEMSEFRSLDVRFVWPEANGQTWICTYGKGFFLQTKQGLTAFPESNGKLAYVHCIVEDAKGYFWMPTNNGLFVTSRQSLMDYSKNHNKIPFYYRFSKKHGLRTNEFNGGSQPAFLRMPDGDISLASMQGLVRFNPDEINFRFSASPIMIDHIQLDSTEVLKLDEFDVANTVNNVSFSLSSSFWGEKENDQLEYQIIEKGRSIADASWLKVDASGKINLFSPSYGNYQLVVRKRNGLGQNDYLYKTISFGVLPKWYQTKAFLLAALLGIILIMLGISYWRRRSYRKANLILKEKVNVATAELQQMNSTLEKRVAERTFAIQQAEIKFRTLVEASLVGVYIVQDNKFIYVNPRFEQIFGYGPGEMIGLDILPLIPRNQRDIADEKLRVRMTGEVENVHYELKVRKKDDTEAYLEIFGRRTDYEGKPTIIGTLLDITERKKMETELREAELKFRDLVEKSMVGVYIIQDGKFAYVNPRLAEMFGYKQEELINSINTTQLVDPESVAMVDKSISAKIEGEIDSNNYEARGLKKDGQKIWMEIYSSATLYQGKNAVIGSVLDITDRKLAKEQLIKEKDLSLSIINSLPGIFYIFDQKGEYQLWNKNHQIVTGYSEEEMKKLHPSDFFEQSELPVLAERIEKVFKEGYAELEAPFLTKDRKKIPYYFNGVNVLYNDKSCIMGVGIDISEQKKAEGQLMLEKDLSQSIINSLPGVLFIFDEDRTHLLWNRNFETVTGYTAEELKKKKAGMCVEEEDIIKFTKAVEKMYASGNAEVEVTLINKEKKRIPFYVNGISITYEGKPCILGVGIDISERKKAEQEKEHANYQLNERIKELTTLYRAGVILQREERSVLVTLQDFVSILPGGWQYPAITAACVKLGELEFATPDYLPGAYSQSATFTTSSGTIGKIEVVYLQERPQEDEGPFLDEERKLIDMLADMLKIHFNRREGIEALQKSEANLHTIFDTTDTFYALLDVNFQLIAFNHQAYDFSVRELKRPFVLNINFSDFFPEDRRDRVATNMKKVMQGTDVSYEISYTQPDGKLNWYYVRMFPITNAQKLVFGMMVAVSDITEKKRLEQEILDQKVQEQKAVIRAILIGEEKERNKIGQELHDNINQILAGTKLYLSMARRAKEKEGQENIINESMGLIDSAIEEIRTLSKAKVTPMKKINLEELLQQLVDGLAGKVNFKIGFVYKGADQFIEDDLKLNIYRIIQEKLNNIIKHAMAKNASVYVEASPQGIYVQVKDDGKGFEPDMKKKGIGLANMINRVESFNGTITINSSPGNGCSMELNIPF